MNTIIVPLADAYGSKRDEPDDSPSSLFASAIKTCIDGFKCDKSGYHVNFIKEKSKHDEDHDTSRTYLIVNKDAAVDAVRGNQNADATCLVVAYFTVGLSSIIVDERRLTKKKAKKVGSYHYSRDGSIGCYAIGEICRSDAYSSADMPGEVILGLCVDMLSEAQNIVGGRLVLVDSKECVFKALYEPFGFKELYVENAEKIEGVPLITSYYRL